MDFKPISTSEKIAEVANVSKKTYRMGAKILNSDNEEVKNAVLSGEMSINAGYNKIRENKKVEDTTETILTIIQPTTTIPSKPQISDEVKQICEDLKTEKTKEYLDSVWNYKISVIECMNADFEMYYDGFISAISDVSFPILSLYTTETTEEEKAETEKTNEKIITEIFQPDAEKKIDIDESSVIVLSPVNEQVLKYLAENPKEFYNLTDADFEIVMAEIYARLGYDVTRKQSTRDGGKDIIIRKPEILGDFIYYVECKKYAPDRHIGVGIIRNLVGTVTTDRVNGGILATTSFFTKPARDFILENKWNCQIKMHDYNMV